MSTGEAIFLGTVAFFSLLAILVFLRLLLRKGPPHWTSLKLGVYIERVPEDPSEADTEIRPPTTYQRPET